MRAMSLAAPAPAERMPLRLTDVPAPEPGAGEVAVAVEACGVCRTDLHLAEGEVEAPLPRIPGHQAAGRVLEVGKGVEGFVAGDRVGVGWVASTCGECRFCLSDRENLCPAAKFTGRDRDGGYAEVLTADARWVYRLPPGLGPRPAAPLLCAGIIGYRFLRLSEIRPGKRLGLFGFGASAHLALQVALEWGCEVYAFTREAGHRALALELGAAWAGETSADPGVPLDAAVTFAPAGEVVVTALSRLAPGAAVAVNAIHIEPDSVVPL